MNQLHRIIIIGWVLLGIAGCASLQTEQDQITALEEPVAEPQAVAGTQISPELLRQEMAIFKKQLMAIHPDPFARVSQSEFEAEFNRVYESLNYPLSRTQFYIQLAPLLARLRDVHSYLNLPKDQFGDLSISGERLFPLAVILHQDKLLVAADLSTKPFIPIGAEITTINGAPVDYLLTVMRKLVARETTSGQARRIQLDFSWLLSAMGYAGENYQISYRWQSQQLEKELVGLAIVTPKKSARPASYYGFTKLTDTTSLLWLNDFNENPEIFESYLTDKFDQMAQQRVENLIIDVRYNQGGLSENLKNLLAHLTDKPIYWADHGQIKISEKLKNNHVDKTRQRREDKYSWGLQWIPLEWTDKLQHSIWWAEDGEMITLQLDSIEPTDGYRPSRVWVLTNGFCYSACSLFVASVNHYQLGRTLGEKAGSLANNQFVYPVEVTLPHSGLTLTLPTMRLVFAPDNHQELIAPQVEILRSLEDIQHRRDPVLDTALTEAELGDAIELGKN